jgi:hypothetical protein
MTKIIYNNKTYKFSLRKIRLNSGGYTPGRYGQYYGVGPPDVYRAELLEGPSQTINNYVEDQEFRASSRQQALNILTELVKQGKFD